MSIWNLLTGRTEMRAEKARELVGKSSAMEKAKARIVEAIEYRAKTGDRKLLVWAQPTEVASRASELMEWAREQGYEVTRDTACSRDEEFWIRW